MIGYVGSLLISSGSKVHRKLLITESKTLEQGS